MPGVRKWLERGFNRLWYQFPRFLAWPLWPLSVLYQGLFFLDKVQKEKQGVSIFAEYQVPVIVVGNLTVGGVGKTPMVLALVELLKQHGFCPGVVSRGYGGKPPEFPYRLSHESTPEQCGDEPLLIFQTAQVPVVVDRNRVRAAEFLVQQESVNVIIADDGLQHHRLLGDLRIVVVDARRQFGNGYCLPAGPLREPLRALDKVDFIVANGSANLAGHESYSMQLQPGNLYNLVEGKAHSLTARAFQQRFGQKIHAVAAIGNPHRFQETLERLGFSVTLASFPDHHHYSERDFRSLTGKPIVMTEKDAIKCRHLSVKAQSIWVLPVTASLDHNFQQQLLARLSQFSTSGMHS